MLSSSFLVPLVYSRIFFFLLFSSVHLVLTEMFTVLSKRAMARCAEFMSNVLFRLFFLLSRLLTVPNASGGFWVWVRTDGYRAHGFLCASVRIAQLSREREGRSVWSCWRRRGFFSLFFVLSAFPFRSELDFTLVWWLSYNHHSLCFKKYMVKNKNGTNLSAKHLILGCYVNID